MDYTKNQRIVAWLVLVLGVFATILGTFFYDITFVWIGGVLLGVGSSAISLYHNDK